MTLELVHVLNGGLKKWINVEKKKVTSNLTKYSSTSDYKSFEKKKLVKNKYLIDQNIKNQRICSN